MSNQTEKDLVRAPPELVCGKGREEMVWFSQQLKAEMKSAAESRKSSIIDSWQGSKYTSDIQFRIQFTRALWSQTKLAKCKIALLRLHIYILQGEKNVVFRLLRREKNFFHTLAL